MCIKSQILKDILKFVAPVMHFHFCQKYECLGAKNVVLHRPSVHFGLGTVSCGNALLPSGHNVTSTNTGEAATIRQPDGGWLVEWGVYALSASKAIFRARTYNCNLFSPVMPEEHPGRLMAIC